MNPVLLLIAILFLSKQNQSGGYIGKGVSSLNVPGVSGLKFPGLGNSIGYFDTFQMELLIDRLQSIATALEKINHLNQTRNLPRSKERSVERVQDSLEAVRGLLADNKAEKQLDTISTAVSGFKKFGDIENIMAMAGPLLSMLNSQKDD